MARANTVGINLDVFDAFGNKRSGKPGQPPPRSKEPVNVHRATRQLERLIPGSSLWRRPKGYLVRVG